MSPPEPPRTGFSSKNKVSSKEKLFCKAPPDGFVKSVRTVEKKDSFNAEDLAMLGVCARNVVDTEIAETGAILFRGLPMRNAEDFSTFWRGYLDTQPALTEGRYTSMGPATGRDKLSGIDLATNVPPQFPLLCHNEMCYNPTTVGCIALYCVQDAKEGGETILARNRELGLPKKAIKFLDDHGGIKYVREYYNAIHPPENSTPGQLGSWQAKCGLDPTSASKADAEDYWFSLGFNSSHVEWTDEGELRVSNFHPGYIVDSSTGKPSWWNIAHTGSVVAGDGTPFPKKMVADIQTKGWEKTYAFKLLPGDW
eukprot:CAMPEP_0171624644 /NCGR_PEP_ID=MMETSP0990-20121206/18761_1 /TAXON_ID=483369 /ORGANISM="non described non described, Strain CCMP2098" /LENGTH=309 /DNA_ID=CAMNT_0012191271 /DNA_START=128 /DNA_END=1054 /DNA_ORIENTATION=-